MTNLWKSMGLFFVATWLTLGAGAMAPSQAQASIQRMTIRGHLYYTSGNRGKSFTWRLRLYSTTGIVIGSSSDRDGFATFFGTYNTITKRFHIVKKFSGSNQGLYYKGAIRGNRIDGSAHATSFWGARYAGFYATTTFSNYNYTLGTPKRFHLRGNLRFNQGNSKAFSWKLNYYPSSGRCYGTTQDREGRAVFEGVYDRPTKRFFLRKRFYGTNKYLYYRGHVSGNTVYGDARNYSFTSRDVYARWTANMLWQSGGGNGEVDTPTQTPPPTYQPTPGIKYFTLTGRIRYIRGGGKSFTWKLRYYPTSGKCFGETYDKEGKASFWGNCNPETGTLQLRKRFAGSTNYLYYTGTLTRTGATGVARRFGFSGSVYATWRASILWRGR